MPDSAAAPDPTCRPEPLLVMRGIVKQFPGVRALDGVDLDLRAGEVHCLLGQNEPARLANPTAAMRAGIATICQELDLVDGLSVAANILLGHERSAFGFTGAARSTVRPELSCPPSAGRRRPRSAPVPRSAGCPRRAARP